MFPGGSFRGSVSWQIAAILLAGAATLAECQTTQAPIQTTEQSASIHGVVVNASTNKPLARALAQVDGHSILTAYDGRFEFTALSATTTTLHVMKPGFYEGSDLNQTTSRSVTVGSPDDVIVKLYPEALITGNVSESNGDPLAQVQVQALRRVEDESGPRWTMAGQMSTNSDGQFRLALPGGEYVVETQYVPERLGVHGAILPIMIPAAGTNGGSGTAGGGGASTLRMSSGSEQHLDLHPPVRPAHEVHIQVDSSGSVADPGQFSPQIQVHLANGLVFSPQSHEGERQGEVVVNLPNGSYLLSAGTGVRDDAASYGETRVTVADENVAGVAIHLQKALMLPIEVSVDPAASVTDSTAGSAPAADPGSTTFAQQLGIFLQRIDVGVGLRTQTTFLPVSQRGGPIGFTLLPGRYRLQSRGYSQWFVESATAGGTDLLTQEFVVDGSSSSQPLRLVVNNQAATIKGTTKVGEQLAQSYVYMIATTPSATPVIRSNAATSGSFSRNLIPPGSYRVVASEARLNLDLSDSAVQRQLAPYTKTVTVSAGETGSVDLDAMPASELTP